MTLDKPPKSPAGGLSGSKYKIAANIKLAAIFIIYLCWIEADAH